MARLIITTRNGVTSESEVRDYREAESEIARFERVYLAQHPRDAISDISVIDHTGSLIARSHNGRLEMFP